MISLSEYIPVNKRQGREIQVPSFISGSFADSFVPVYESQSDDNLSFIFHDRDESGVLQSSSVLSSGLANYVLRDTNFRVAVPTDNIYQDIFPMIDGNFYTDLNALDVWDSEPKYSKNQQIYRDVIAVANSHVKNTDYRDVRFPFRIQGFYMIPDESSGGKYHARIEPAENFRVIDDEQSRKRLDLPTGTMFDSLDKNGMIIPMGSIQNVP